MTFRRRKFYRRLANLRNLEPNQFGASEKGVNSIVRAVLIEIKQRTDAPYRDKLSGNACVGPLSYRSET